MLSRRLRGLLGVMTTWGIAFSAFATISISAVILSGIAPDVLGFRHVPLIALRGFLAGALSGGLFAALLVGRERSKTVATMSLGRVTAWGFLGGAALPAVTMLALNGIQHLPIGAIITSIVSAGAIGAGIAATSVHLARRAPELPLDRATPELPSR
jgi:hypothetical protein